jgi:hypothetical protein
MPEVPVHVMRSFYHPIATPEEIDRILEPRNARDYLLALRANTIVDHMRLFRVFRNKALANEDGWTLESAFSDTHYKRYLRSVDEADRHELAAISYGNLFSNEPNGQALTTEYGPIVTICDSMQFFCKFAHLALLEFDSEVPLDVRHSAMSVSIRVMMKTEALDFYMDPRGIIPVDVAEAIHAPIPLQLEWIAGHEFAHILLGHLDEGSTYDRWVLRMVGDQTPSSQPEKYYTVSQRQELEADVDALTRPEYGKEKRLAMRNAAVLWLAAVEVWDRASQVLAPRNPWMVSEHPPPRERIANLISAVPLGTNAEKDWFSDMERALDFFCETMEKSVTLNPDFFENYGSVYLGPPNSDWRGRELIDRKDYY